MRFARAWTMIAMGFALALGAPGCTRSHPSATPASESEGLGRPLFDFDSSLVQEILIARADPASGQNWTARLARRPGGDWEIGSAPQGANLLDRRADTGFINHLLDTLRTLRWTDRAPRGPLESFGLARPHWSLRWNDGTHSFEVQLGNVLDDHSRAYAKDSADGDVKIVRGAALKMLEYVTSFEALRRRTLLTFPSDDVDEFTVYHGGSRLFYAQRLNDDWADARNKPLRYDAGAYLEMLTHLRVDGFEDDPSLAKAREKQVNTHPEFRVVLKDRAGKPTELRIARVRGQGLWATLSSRPESAFQLYPEAWAALTPARKN